MAPHLQEVGADVTIFYLTDHSKVHRDTKGNSSNAHLTIRFDLFIGTYRERPSANWVGANKMSRNHAVLVRGTDILGSEFLRKPPLGKTADSFLNSRPPVQHQVKEGGRNSVHSEFHHKEKYFHRKEAAHRVLRKW